MSTYVIFDTNYLISLGLTEFRERSIPESLRNTLKKVSELGYVIMIPQTVNSELSAWINQSIKKQNDRTEQAYSLLKDSGYKVTPAYSPIPEDVDAFSLIRNEFEHADLLEPELDDYKHAEFLASNKMDPKPKNADGEEFRDRVIWSQAVRLATNTKKPVLIVSGDTLFENGSTSEQGIELNIGVAKDEQELLQRLGERPPVIEHLIQDVSKFSDALREQGVTINIDKIGHVDDYRSANEGSNVIKRFSFSGDGIIDGYNDLHCQMLYIADQPLILTIQLKDKGIEVIRNASDEEWGRLRYQQQLSSLEKQAKEQELRDILSGN